MSNYVNKEEQSVFDEYAKQLPIARTGVLEGTREMEVDVTTRILVQDITDVANQLIIHQVGRELTYDLGAYLSSLVHYRVMQIQGKSPRNFDTIAIPNFFFPVLTSLGKYEDPMRAIAIVPTSSYEPMTPEEMAKASFELRAFGLSVSLGLPRKTRLETDDIFRVSEVDGELRIAGDQVSNVILLVRTAVRVEFLKEFFANPRTRYMTIDDSKPTWESAVFGLLFEGK